MSDDKTQAKQGTFLVRVGRGTGSTLRGLAAGYLVLRQEHYLFPEKRRIPGKDGLDIVLDPEEYPQLQGRGIRENVIRDPAGNLITIYERKQSPEAKNKVTYVLFHGQAGHWFDGGPAPKKRYPKQVNIGRANGLQYIEAAAETGAGIIAVSLPGYGKTPGDPGEESFTRAITGVVDHVVKQIESGELKADQIVAAGESLGGASALEFAAQMKERGYAIAQVDMMNPFTIMAEISSEALRNDPDLRKAPTLSADFLKKYLDHHFNNMAKLERIGRETTIHIGTSMNDSKIDHHHSEDLVARAGEGNPAKKIVGLGLHVVASPFPENNHRNWKPAELIAKSIHIYNARRGIADDEGMMHWLNTHTFSEARPLKAQADWKARIRKSDSGSPEDLSPAA